MNILMAHWAWYPSGGDWTYIDSVCKVYESHGHAIIPFAMHHERNIPSKYEKYFINKIDYKKINEGKSIQAGIQVLRRSIYSLEAKRKLSSLLSDVHVDIGQLNSINNYQTPSIIPILKQRHIPVVWRILDYKLLCPNTTFVVNDALCEACFKHKYYHCILNRCKKNSYLASSVAALESYTYYLLPYYKQVDLFLFQSEFTRDMFVKYGYDIKKTHIIENPYESKNIQPCYSGKNYILYFGRLEKVKGIYTLLEAMKMLPHVQLKIVGDGSEYQNIMRYITNESLANVALVGPKWNNDLEPLVRDCEFVIVPSEWYEPSPYVVLQAFSFGKPVIASNMGGLKDVIRENENGMVFEAGNSNALSAVIGKMLYDKNKIQRMGAAGRHLVETKHDPERYYTDTVSLFTNLITGRTHA